MVIITGWKAIGEQFNIKTVKTIKKIAKENSLPVKYINGKPTILVDELTKWWYGLKNKSS